MKNREMGHSEQFINRGLNSARAVANGLSRDAPTSHFEQINFRLKLIDRLYLLIFTGVMSV